MPQETASTATKWQKEGHFKVISQCRSGQCLPFLPGSGLQAPERNSQTLNSQHRMDECGLSASLEAAVEPPVPDPSMLSVTPGAG